MSGPFQLRMGAALPAPFCAFGMDGSGVPIIPPPRAPGRAVEKSQ